MHRFPIDPLRLSREVPVRFPGPAGELQGLWRPPRPGTEPRGVLVVAHPHPAYGGTMLNKVVFHVARTLNHDLDVASLRFNFRGVGESQGRHDEGRGEVDDVLAAWREAVRRVPQRPLLAGGFSFGAGMTLLAAARDGEDGTPLPAGLALLGVPIRLFAPPEPFPRPIPVAAGHGERDRYTPPEAVRRYLETWPGPAAFEVFPGADHFLEGSLVEAVGFLSRHAKQWLEDA